MLRLDAVQSGMTFPEPGTNMTLLQVRQVPRLTCDECAMRVIGEYDPGTGAATFVIQVKVNRD